MWLLSGFCLRWVSFRFKFKVLCTYSVFILLATLFFFSMIPSGLLIKITWKETPRRRTPPHLTRTHCHTRADTRRHARASCTQGREPGDLGQCCATQAERGGAKPWAPPASGAALSALHQRRVGFCACLGSPLERGCLSTPAELETYLMSDPFCHCVFFTQH